MFFCLIFKADQVPGLHLDLDVVPLVIEDVVKGPHGRVQLIHLHHIDLDKAALPLYSPACVARV